MLLAGSQPASLYPKSHGALVLFFDNEGLAKRVGESRRLQTSGPEDQHSSGGYQAG